MTKITARHETSCWNNVFSTEWDSFITQHHLQPRQALDKITNDKRFHAIADAIIAGLNITDDFVSILRSDTTKITVISSYDTAGPLHFGNALVLRQLKVFHDIGCRVRIPMVDAEAVAIRGLTPQEAVDMAEQSMIPIFKRAWI